MTERMRVVVTVKAYPQMSAHRGEVVCVAGLRVDLPGPPQWVRLFPFDFRDMDSNLQFKKWDVIELDADRPSSDRRPESWEPDPDSIEIVRSLPSTRGWAARWDVIGAVDTVTTCGLYRSQQTSRTSLGIVKPHVIEDFEIESIPDADQRQVRADIATGPDLLDPDRRSLEVIPWRFKYVYRCAEPTCKGHSQSIIDWEIHQAYRRWRRQYGNNEVFSRLRTKWFDQMCAPARDTRFFLGNMHRSEAQFLVLGVFWPPRLPSSEDVDDLDARI